LCQLNFIFLSSKFRNVQVYISIIRFNSKSECILPLQNVASPTEHSFVFIMSSSIFPLIFLEILFPTYILFDFFMQSREGLKSFCWFWSFFFYLIFEVCDYYQLKAVFDPSNIFFCLFVKIFNDFKEFSQQFSGWDVKGC